ncbi:MAG TPA: WYL domain-containing protein [Acidimicrobiales bacterium]|nr:WYL domain-containing protein [Acidimicrobiales bacterium]
MTRTAAQDRLGRLLAIVPWVAAQHGPEIAEVCRRFGITERELLADLDLLFLCGVYPFTPDVLIEVDIADGRVWIRFADYFRRPLRLTPPEGLALIGAGAALLRVPGADPDGALARALDKLATVLGVGADDAVEVELGPVKPEILELVQEAAALRHRVELDYYSFGRDERSTRVVEPWQVFNTRGQWYLAGYCQQAGGERLFRVDRISRIGMLSEEFNAPAEPPPATVFHGGRDDPVVVLDLTPSARWVAEQYPNEGVVERPDNRLRVTLRVSERAWLERLVLRAGSDAAMVEGDATVRADAARRILTRYRPTAAGSVS